MTHQTPQDAPQPLRLVKPDVGPKVRKSLSAMASEARGADGVPGCRQCGGRLTKRTAAGVTCSHCGRPRRG